VTSKGRGRAAQNAPTAIADLSAADLSQSKREMSPMKASSINIRLMPGSFDLNLAAPCSIPRASPTATREPVDVDRTWNQARTAIKRQRASHLPMSPVSDTAVPAIFLCKGPQAVAK